jgi:hypothetical protein
MKRQDREKTSEARPQHEMNAKDLVNNVMSNLKIHSRIAA